MTDLTNDTKRPGIAKMCIAIDRDVARLLRSTAFLERETMRQVMERALLREIRIVERRRGTPIPADLIPKTRPGRHLANGPWG